jgi:hypothetical protein
MVVHEEFERTVFFDADDNIYFFYFSRTLSDVIKTIL